MKKVVLSLLFVFMTGMSVSAQTKSDVTYGIVNTMNDFISDLNILFDEGSDSALRDHHIKTVSFNFSSPEYFNYNGQGMNSFDHWLAKYYGSWSNVGKVNHELTVSRHSVRKFAPNESSDKRWTFDAELVRSVNGKEADRQNVTFIVLWKGSGQNTQILDVKGNLILETTSDLHKMLLGTKYDFIGKFSTGVSIAPIRYKGKYGFIQKDGTVVAHPIYDEIGCESLQGKSANDNTEWSDIFKYMSVKKEGKWGYIDRTGKVVLPCIYDKITGYVLFAGTWTLIACKDGMYGALSENLETKIPFVYQNLYRAFYKNGWMLAKKDDKYGFIDETGKVVFPIIHEFAEEFYGEQRAAVVMDGKIGFIDTSGKLVIPCIYDVEYYQTNKRQYIRNSDFIYGSVAWVLVNGKWGLIDMDGKPVTAFEYSSITKRDVNGFVAVKNGKQVIIDFHGNEYKDVETRNEQADSVMAVQGRAQSMYNMGVKHYKNKNYKLANDWFVKANLNEYDDAAYYLGKIHYHGQGVSSSYVTAYDFFKKAANSGSIEACDYLGWMTARGQGTKKNLPEAIEWYTKCGVYYRGYELADSLKMVYANGHEYVDLGLSVKWATCNVGATTPTQLGDKFGWGERVPNKVVNKKNSYTYNEKYPTNLNDSRWYNTASQIMKGEWRMPTREELTELIEKCKWVETNNVEGKGYMVYGPNGNHIFIPDVYGAGIFLWSSERFDKKQAFYIYIDNTLRGIYATQTYASGYVRGVID